MRTQCGALPRGLLIAVALASGGPVARAASEVTTTPLLIAQAAASSLSCGYWHVSGVCFWLHCTIFSCKVRTSTRYSHMRPDAVVSTYHDASSHPWPEIGVPIARATQGAGKAILGGLFDSAGSRTRTSQGRAFANSRTDRMRDFKDGDLIGHPGGAIFPRSCPSGVQAFRPYYQSVLDSFVWRGILPVELLHPASFIPGLREVGTGGLGLINTWGNVFPRHGDTTQQHPVKGAAVLSQRIADFTTRAGQPHVYSQLPANGVSRRNNDLVWNPPSARENWLRGGLWQLSAPPVGAAAAACTVFGFADLGPLSYGDFSTSSTMSYAFTLWRPYGCCRIRGAFIGAITWGLW